MACHNPRILVITVSSWNDKIGANTWVSLLEKYDSENIANICIRDEFPNSHICSKYFVISENRILKSILHRNIGTGCEINENVSSELYNSQDLKEHNQRYQKMRRNRSYLMLLVREIVWKLGAWRTKELDAFLDSFKPDIILHSMEGYIHLNRIIEYSINRTGAKAIGYIWDDNFTYKQSSKLGYKFYRFFQRKSLKKLAKKTNDFFAISNMTKTEADKFFGINCHLLTKPLNDVPEVKYNEIKLPIKILYTGNLFIGRDDSLVKVVKAIEKLPKDTFAIDVYTKSELSNKIKSTLDDSICRIHSTISQNEVHKKQKEADLLLFLEDIDGKDAHAARLSFSTKITDYLSSGRCILAVGCRDTVPMRYFIENNAAITACSEDEILSSLMKIINTPNILVEYAENARIAGMTNHNKEKIQRVFDTVIASVMK